MSKKVVIIGASGHGKVVADIAEKNGYTDIVFLDDNPSVKSCGAYSVAGTTEMIEQYADWDFFVAIGNAKIRQKIQTMCKSQGFSVASMVHPAAIVAPDVQIGCGSAVMAGVVINSGSVIGEGCVINTGATVDHDNVIGDYVHISVGSHLAGTVQVGMNTWIGAGAVVSNNLNICGDCMIGAGAVVVSDITEAATYVGVPAKKVKK